MRKLSHLIMGCLLALLSVTNMVSAKSYQVKTLLPKTLNKAIPPLPDISIYTPVAVKKAITDALQSPPGKVSLRLMKGLVELRILYSGNGMLEMGLIQGDLPSALVVEQGVMTLQQVSQAYPDQLVALGEDEYLAKKPIVVAIDGTLIIKDNVLKLSEDKGAFLVNGGQLFLQGGSLTGWRESLDGPAYYTGDKHSFRPFFVSWGGSNTYFSETEVSSLGYFNTKTYGITVASYHLKPEEKIFQRDNFDFSKSPGAWFINSTFSDMFYGFYSFEADDIAVINNTYIDNIIYGIDPHDRSRRLIIANNNVSGTKKKHGIIMSRDVTDSFIFGNESYNNKLSGIMLDRRSTNNQIVRNKVHHNGSDGITIYESGDNQISENTIFANKSHGIRLRNSENVTLSDNLILANKAYGVYLHTRNLSDNKYRDVKKDPYKQEVSGLLSGGVVAYNSSGSIFVENSHRFSLYNVVIENNGTETSKLQFGGDLADYHNEIVRSLWREKGVASLQRKGDF